MNAYMTIEKDKSVKIPLWLISVALPILVALVTSIVAYSATTAELKEKTSRHEKQLEMIENNKVDRNEIKLILEQLNRIENKLEKLQDKDQ